MKKENNESGASIKNTRTVPEQYTAILADPRFRRYTFLLEDESLGKLMRIEYSESHFLVSKMALPVQSLEPPSADALRRGFEVNMVRIPSGTFSMGSTEYDDERPVHAVTLQSFDMGATPVTQEQYESVMGNNPSHFKNPSSPVENVSWHDAVAFCAELKNKTRLEYTLPTEAQWEYACRAGSTTRFCFGDNEAELSEYAWYGSNSEGRTHPVGEKQPNKWGLYDMHGNVWEWCLDSWHPNYDKVPAGGSVWEEENSATRVLRGGSWSYPPEACRSSSRNAYTADYRAFDIGFRVVRTP